MERRIQVLKDGKHPDATPLAEAVALLGKHYSSISAAPEPVTSPKLPEWLVQALRDQLELPQTQITHLAEDEAKALLTELWSPSQH